MESTGVAELIKQIFSIKIFKDVDHGLIERTMTTIKNKRLLDTEDNDNENDANKQEKRAKHLNVVLSLNRNTTHVSAIVYSLEFKTTLQVLTSEISNLLLWKTLQVIGRHCDIISGDKSKFNDVQTDIPELWTKEWIMSMNNVPIPTFMNDLLRNYVPPTQQSLTSARYISICDTETTDSYITARYKYDTIEIAILLFDVETGNVVSEASTLIPTTKSNDAFQWNKIDTKCIDLLHNDQILSIFEFIQTIVTRSDLIVAHWAEMDRWSVGKIKEVKDYFFKAKWVCSCSTLHWPKYKVRKMFRGRPANPKLEDLCTDYGVSYQNGHRGLTDSRLLLQCFVQRNDLASFEK